MSLVNTQETALLDYVNGKTVPAPPATVFYGLHVGKAAPNADTGAGVVEPTDANYARVAKTLAEFWGAAVAGSPAVATNAQEINFGTTANAYSSEITHVVEFDAASGGNVRRIFAMPTAKTPGAGDEVKVPVGSLTSKLGVPTDTY